MQFDTADLYVRGKLNLLHVALDSRALIYVLACEVEQRYTLSLSPTRYGIAQRRASQYHTIRGSDETNRNVQ